MANQSPTEPVNNVTVREVDLAAEVRKAWGVKWNEPPVAYEFSNDRKFTLRTEDAAIYSSSPDFG